MIRQSSYDKYEEIVRLGFQRFFNEAKLKALDPTDFLLCQQGGCFDWSGYPCIGFGEVGLNNIQKVNIINSIGGSIVVSDEDYFKINGNQFFNGLTDFERGIVKVCNLYLDVWENEWFLRNFAEVVRVANGEHYDWNLDLSKLKETGKGNFIRKEIIGKLNQYPYLQEILKIGYCSDLRNAVGHSQYHVIQGGIWLDSYGRNKYTTIQALSFEDWEKIVLYGWLTFRLLFSTLRQMTMTIFLNFAKISHSGGVPILIPSKDGGWSYRFIYPNVSGCTWSFVKTMKNTN